MSERDRLVKIMECEGMNAKQFSQEVGISAGTISNILGGRNRPSLEVMQAILRRFRSISCLWLITGAGSMYINDSSEESSRTLFPDMEPHEPVSYSNVQTPPAGSEEASNKQKNSGTGTLGIVASSQDMDSRPARSVQKVLIFYTDGTFEER